MSIKCCRSAVFGCLIAGVEAAETLAERDAIRESYFAEFSCHVISQGQPMKLEYQANGQGVQAYQVACDFRISLWNRADNSIFQV